MTTFLLTFFFFFFFFFFFLVGGGGIGQRMARQRHVDLMAFRWHADNGPTLNAGLVALLFLRGSSPVLLRNPISL